MMKKPELTKEIREKILNCLQDAIASLDDIDPENDKAEIGKREKETKTTTPPTPNPK
ncbi:hypothetical protein ACFL7E_07640 [Thermodesulfobacteriota bacterium]